MWQQELQLHAAGQQSLQVSSLGWCATQRSVLMMAALVQVSMGALCCTVSLLCWLYLCAVVHVLQVPRPCVSACWY